MIATMNEEERNRSQEKQRPFREAAKKSPFSSKGLRSRCSAAPGLRDA